MTKSKAYYQAYLVIQCLSQEEYSLIPKDLIEEIESKMEKDPTITVDKTVPLEKQKIDDKAYDILDRVIRAIEKKYGADAIDNPSKYANVEDNQKNESQKPPKTEDDMAVIKFDDEPDVKPAPKKTETVEIGEDGRTPKKQREDNLEVRKLKEENIKLKGIISALEKENEKIDEARELFLNYKELFDKKEERIRVLESENEGLKQANEQLHRSLKSVPKLIGKIFIKDYSKMLNSGK
jgi:hypothetical protein